MTELDADLLHRERSPGRAFDLHGDLAAIPEIYVDGISGGGVGPAIARIDFYTTVTMVAEEGFPQVEKRRVKVRLVMPTQNWVEGVASLMGQLQNSAVPLLEAVDQQKKILSAALLKQTP